MTGSVVEAGVGSGNPTRALLSRRLFKRSVLLTERLELDVLKIFACGEYFDVIR